MQTFLPLPDFRESAAVMDRLRLGKQRVEALQILRALADPEYGWQNHPAVRMWRGHAGALVRYGTAVCDEWTSRGYRDGCRDKIAVMADPATASDPPWLGDDEFHASHRAALLLKDPDHYGRFGWAEEPAYDYVWPVD